MSKKDTNWGYIGLLPAFLGLSGIFTMIIFIGSAVMHAFFHFIPQVSLELSLMIGVSTATLYGVYMLLLIRKTKHK